ncbi:MAG: hypothetical protein ABSG64_12160 [Solirubrobacteraceae bacterium]|jgi:aryl-alcohol dehydrogenase-like predicted oxidoreductase
MSSPGIAALGTWSGGRFMRFGEPVAEDRLVELLTPGERVRTVLSADVYGWGQADRLLARSLARLPREAVCVIGAVGLTMLQLACEWVLAHEAVSCVRRR